MATRKVQVRPHPTRLTSAVHVTGLDLAMPMLTSSKKAASSESLPTNFFLHQWSSEYVLSVQQAGGVG